MLGLLVLGFLALLVPGRCGFVGVAGSWEPWEPEVFSVVVAYLRVVAGYFKGCFVGGSVRVIEDILLSERDGNARLSSNGRASHV